MRNTRKGFTLVELLIVVAILATLTAAMTTSISGATAKAKASTIASNVNACISAARLYAVNNASDGLDDLTADEVLFASLPTWKDFKLETDAKGVSYEATTDKGESKWAIKVDFSSDPEKDAIRTALIGMKGYGNSYAQSESSGTYTYTPTPVLGATGSESYKFKVTLISGKIEADS